MDQNGRDRFEIPKDMRSMAEASFEQARKAFETFVSNTQQAASSIEQRNAAMKDGARDISGKLISFAEKNVTSSLDYAESLLKAKDFTEVMRLHSDYVQTQMRTLSEQASEMGQLVSRAAMDAARPKG
jgi:phasin